MSLGITLTGDAIWTQGNEGKTSKLFSAPLLSITCKLDLKGRVPAIWYDDSAATEEYAKMKAKPCEARFASTVLQSQRPLMGTIIAPVPPYSTDAKGNIVGGGAMTLTASAAEVGAPSPVLCALANAFKDQKGSTQGALSTAIDDRIGRLRTTVTPGGGGGGAGGGGGSRTGEINACGK